MKEISWENDDEKKKKKQREILDSCYLFFLHFYYLFSRAFFLYFFFVFSIWYLLFFEIGVCVCVQGFMVDFMDLALLLCVVDGINVIKVAEHILWSEGVKRKRERECKERTE